MRTPFCLDDDRNVDTVQNSYFRNVLETWEKSFLSCQCIFAAKLQGIEGGSRLHFIDIFTFYGNLVEYLA